MEPNITEWRRTVVGDLTSAFNFESPNSKVVALPDTSSYQPTNQNRYPDYVPTPPTNQSLPEQEPGTRPARALPYELHVHGEVEASQGGIEFSFRNTGKAGAVFQVRSGDGKRGPWTYTLGAGDETSDTLGASGATSYDYSVYGPSGFLRTFVGSLAPGSAKLTVNAIYEEQWEGGVALVIRNHGSSTEKVSILDWYSGKAHTLHVHPHDSLSFVGDLRESFGWYDLTVTVDSDASFQRQLAGHVETGKPSMSDPAIGGRVPEEAEVA
jgi:phospholipase C